MEPEEVEPEEVEPVEVPLFHREAPGRVPRKAFPQGSRQPKVPSSSLDAFFAAVEGMEKKMYKEIGTFISTPADGTSALADASEVAHDEPVTITVSG